MVGVATNQTPFQLVLAFDLHVSYDHSQHLFMNVDSRYPVRHNFPPGGSGERAASSLSRVTGYRRSHRRGETTPNYSLNHARDRKSTRLNSSHVKISYAVFCLKKKRIHNRECKRTASLRACKRRATLERSDA